MNCLVPAVAIDLDLDQRRSRRLRIVGRHDDRRRARLAHRCNESSLRYARLLVGFGCGTNCPEEGAMKQMKHSGRLGALLFWAGLLTICWQAANADQILRPPMPIPTQPRPPIRPAPIPAKLTPPPVTAPISPFPVALPPVEFDHEYKGKLTVLKQDNYLLIRELCRDVPTAIACSYRTYNSQTGEQLSCLIMLGPWFTTIPMRCGMRLGTATDGQITMSGRGILTRPRVRRPSATCVFLRRRRRSFRTNREMSRRRNLLITRLNKCGHRENDEKLRHENRPAL